MAAYGFDGTKPGLFGPGIIHFLNKWSGRTFEFDAESYIREVSVAGG